MPVVLKIIVDGSFNSGKTSFIRTISEVEVRWIETLIDSNDSKSALTMDCGVISVDEEIFLFLLGMPNRGRFSFDWWAREQQVIGHIIMVDAAFPETWREARSLIETFKAFLPRPFVVVANKQDLPNSEQADYVGMRLRVPEEIPVLPCVATDKESVKHVLLALLDEILKWQDALENEDDDPLIEFISGTTDLAERSEHILKDEFGHKNSD